MLLQACAGFMIPGVKVHVLDEPFAGINPVVKDTLIDLILQENRSRGATFLIVSHEMEIIRRICPRVTVMIAGTRRGRRPARRDRAPRGRDHRLSRTLAAMNGALLTVQDVHAGYLPGVDILRGSQHRGARRTRSRW